MTKPCFADMEEPHEPHWISRSAFQLIVIILALVEIALGAALYRDNIWAAVLLVILASHLMHGLLIGFHEASHGLLRRSRRFNEFDGVLIGILSLMSFSLYRAAHQTHHAFLATERDEELWPFVHPDKPRWVRCLAAFLELTAGFLFTPFLFFRTFLRPGSPIRAQKVRRRIWMEIALMAVVWIAMLSAVAAWGLWKYFLWMYLIPAFVAANLQSWRKYIEHVGLLGSTPNSSTRSIVSEGWAGRLLALSLLHEPFHGIHHRHSGLPHPELPQRVAELEPAAPGERPPFPSYRAAALDLLRNLGDPRVGAQWMAAPAPVEPVLAKSVSS